ncbi:hypothetical protein FOF48_28720 [Corallococcus sp. Z5C101001]|nr:hypothetical protein FOF48_28720 [Corallococcus sp. Z5C101001]
MTSRSWARAASGSCPPTATGGSPRTTRGACPRSPPPSSCGAGPHRGPAPRPGRLRSVQVPPPLGARPAPRPMPFRVGRAWEPTVRRTSSAEGPSGPCTLAFLDALSESGEDPSPCPTPPSSPRWAT